MPPGIGASGSDEMTKMTAIATMTGPQSNRGREYDPITRGADRAASRRRCRRRRSRRTSWRRAAAARADRRASASRRRLTRTARTRSSARRVSSLAPLCDVEGVEHDEHVQQAGDDEEGVAVLVGDGDDAPLAGARQLGDEVREADADVRERRQRDERLRQLERKEAPLDPQPEREHQRQGDEEDDPLLSSS